MLEAVNKAARRIAQEVFNERNVDALDDLLALTYSTTGQYSNRSMGSMDSSKRSGGCSPPSQASVTTSRP